LEQLSVLEVLSDAGSLVFPGHLFDDNSIADGPITKYQGNIWLKIFVTDNTFFLLLSWHFHFYVQVASALLSCAFVYDIFWVFISPLIFHESVMIAVSLSFKTYMLIINLFSTFCLIEHLLCLNLYVNIWKPVCLNNEILYQLIKVWNYLSHPGGFFLVIYCSNMLWRTKCILTLINLFAFFSHLGINFCKKIGATVILWHYDA